MTTPFGGEAWDLCCELGQEKKLDPTLNPTPTNILASNNQDQSLLIFNHLLVIT